MKLESFRKHYSWNSNGIMHILHIVNNCNKGGAGFVILPLIEELNKQNVKFTVAYFTGPENLKEEYQKAGAATVLLGKNPFKIFKKFLTIIKDKHNPVTAIHTHLVQASLFGRTMGLLFNIPIVTTRHYLDRKKKYNILYFLEDFSLRWSDAVIAISKAVKQYLIHKGYSTLEQCKTIYNPINVSLLKTDDAIPLTDRTTIVCNARFIPLKGLKYLVDAFTKIGEALPESTLMLIGPYEEGNSLIPLIQKHVYANRIHVKGRLLREEIFKELSKARIYVQPSLSEGLGLAAVEAMGMECPCVFTKVGGLIDLSNDGQNAVRVPARNSTALSEEIIDLWHDIPKSIRIASNAKKFINTNFASTIIAPQYLQMYRDISHD